MTVFQPKISDKYKDQIKNNGDRVVKLFTEVLAKN